MPENSVRLVRIAAFLLLAVFFYLLVRFATPKNPCSVRCQEDAACHEALARDGIAPAGSTRNDPGLCNGICVTIRRNQRESERAFAQMGQQIPLHPCLRPLTKE